MKKSSALIIANGESCNMRLLKSYLNQIAFVLVLDGAIKKVSKLNIAVDALIGDFDSIFKAEIYLKKYSQLKIVHTPNQNKTDLEKGIEFLIQQKITTAFLFWATGKRADHNLNNLSAMIKYKNKIELIIIDDYSKIFNLPFSFTKYYSKAQNVSLLPMSKVEGLTTKGLKYDSNNAVLELGKNTSSSNAIESQTRLMINFKKGDLLLMECVDKKQLI